MSKPKNPSRRLFLGSTAASLVGSALKIPDALADSRKSVDDVIVRAAIHPGIGIARVGNSLEHDGFFIGPEVIEPPLTTAGTSRDIAGAIKRQAARFRIYGYNANGEVVRELTSDDAEIAWQVQLANKKSAWYRFIAALDLPEAKNEKVIRRNHKIKGEGRASLVINPGARSIGGKSVSGEKYHFNSGRFMGEAVSLGELRTDGKGRLLVLGGHGKSGSPTSAKLFTDPDSFNNSDGWYDDISDGPVSASVKIHGRKIPVEGSWVCVAPPNFAPNAVGWRTLYDLLAELYIANGMMPEPSATSFTNDVLPTLRRLSGLQWVNEGFAKLYGKGAPLDFESAAVIAKLAARGTGPGFELETQTRLTIFNFFRSAQKAGDTKAKLWPTLYGDAYGTFDSSERINFIVPDLTMIHLKRWAAGEFIADWDTNARSPARPLRHLSDVPLAERPAMLDRAALHFCLADAFHPGCELTWPMRHISMYSAPFRIKRAPKSDNVDYGEELTAEALSRPDGPLNVQGPGDLTRWMAVPWQGDTVFCRSGYEPKFDPHLPTFWPARVPNHVLSEIEYAIVMDVSVPREDRVKAFKKRQHWTRVLSGEDENQVMQVVNGMERLGIVEARPGFQNDADFPAVIFVETLAPGALKPKSRGGGPVSAGHPGSADNDDPVIAAGWESAEQLEQFKKRKTRGKPK